MRDIVELCDDGVKQFRTGETILSLYLGRKVAEDNDGRLVGSDEDRSNQELEML
jgi:hypothetical protein